LFLKAAGNIRSNYQRVFNHSACEGIAGFISPGGSWKAAALASASARMRSSRRGRWAIHSRFGSCGLQSYWGCLVDDMLDADPRGKHLRAGALAVTNMASALQSAALTVIYRCKLGTDAKLVALESVNERRLAKRPPG
jgi:hypothetical protein